MKKILEFNCPEENEEYRLHEKGPNAFRAIERIRNEVFRPARKHGYSDEKITELIKKNPGAEELIGELESLFWSILQEEDSNE
jgi:hypothetical protein